MCHSTILDDEPVVEERRDRAAHLHLRCPRASALPRHSVPRQEHHAQRHLRAQHPLGADRRAAGRRIVRFENDNGNIVVECAYDHMGRRATKKVTTNGVVTLHQRYIYRGYLQIAACDLTRAASPALPSSRLASVSALMGYAVTSCSPATPRQAGTSPLGSHPIHRHTPPRHPQRRRLVRLWLGPHPATRLALLTCYAETGKKHL